MDCCIYKENIWKKEKSLGVKMRRELFILGLIAVLTLFVAGCSSEAQESQEHAQEVVVQESLHDCPRGITHDPAPGVCPLYVDANNDGYCDHG